VVYADRARITRRAHVDCAQKTITVEFPGLPASADADTLQADATGARVVAVRWERMKVPPDVPAVTAALTRNRAETATVKQRLERTAAADERADGYDALVTKWAEQALWRSAAAPAKWAAAVETVVEERLAVAREHRTAAARLRALEGEEAALVRELQARERAQAQPPVSARVHLDCTGASASVSLSYLAAGAGWQPVYEVRARDGAIELSTHAAVHQSTGEPWNDVHLSLSTARPGDRATPPVLQPLVVWSEARETARQIVAATEEITRAPTAEARGAAPAPAAIREHHGLATDLVVPGTARVPTGGAAVRLLVARTRHAAKVRLRATPRLSGAAFRIAELVNDTPFPLLPGRLEIFRQGTFVGAQALPEEIPVGARLVVCFGVEERVRVGRLILRETERKTGLLGGTRLHQFAYRFHLASHLAAAEELELVDHIPVSQLDDVAVAVEPATTAGHRLEPADGTVTWRILLRPGEERTVDLAFHVEVPGGYQ
jgi:uncharacterized protein (TIGR02231 family)